MAKKKHQSAAARRREIREQEKKEEGFQGTSIRLPPDIKFFNVDSEDRRQLIIPDYIVGEGNKYADPGEWHYERSYWTHRIGPRNSLYVCPQKTLGKPCPVCEEFEEMQRSGAEWKDFKHLKAKERQLFVVKEVGDEEWKVWDQSVFVFGDRLDAELQNAEDGEFDFFSDWEDGMLLRMSFKEKKMPKMPGQKEAPVFYEITSINFKPRDPLTQEEIDSIPCLDPMVVVHEYDKIKAVLEGEELEEEEEKDEEEEKEEKEKKPRNSKKRKKQEEDDEDLDEEEEDGDDDEDWDEDFDD